MPEEIQDGQEELEIAQTEEQVEELSTSEEPTEEVQEETQEQELPEDSKERTKREFEKLKANNAELKRKLEEREQLPSVLDYPGFNMPQVSPEVRQQYMQPVAMPQFYPQTPQAPQPKLVDEQGYVNADVLQSQLDRAKEAIKKAEEAQKRADEAQQRISRFEQNAEQERLYKEYPELDPHSGVFNEDAYKLVRDRLTSELIQTGKRDSLKVAQEMSRFFRKQQPSKALEQRKQAMSVTGSQVARTSKPVSEMTIEERLKNLGM